MSFFNKPKTSLADGTRSSDSFSDNLVRTVEVLDLQTRQIIFGGNLQGPDSHLQMVTFGESEFLAAFAKPSPVAKEDMVIWNSTTLNWNQDFPVQSGSEWPARFGAAVVSLEMICPAN